MSLVYFVLVVTVLASVAANHLETMSGIRQPSRVKRGFGTEELQDPDDPEYMKLAEEAYYRYRSTHLDSSILKNIIMIKVTRQVVQGILYRIRFIAFIEPLYGNPRKSELICKSNVWEKVNNQKEFTNTNCVGIDDKQQKRVAREVAGGEEEQDPDDPEYQELAKESFQKYNEIQPDDIIVKKIIVTRATSQVVAGSMKRLEFVVLTNLDFSLVCHSKVWEQPWLNKKDIDVDCVPN